MLFSVMPPPSYPASPPPTKKISPVILGCGGCALLFIIGIVALGMFGYGKLKNVIKSVGESDTVAQEFLTDLRDHRYAPASSLMSPEGRKNLSEAKLKDLAEKAEKALGPLQGWKASPNKVDSKGSNDQLVLTYRYLLNYKKGKAEAGFTFRSVDPFKPSTEISEFSLAPSEGGGSDTSEKPSGKDDQKDSGEEK